MSDLSDELKGWFAYVTDSEQTNNATAIRAHLHHHLEQYLKMHSCPSCEIKEEDKDNFLRGSLMEHNRLRHLVNTDKIALAYWRHGHEGTCNPINNEWMGGVPVTCAGAEMMQPGMGMEEECFNSFLAYSVKERLVHQYFIDSGSQSRSANSKRYVASCDQNNEVYLPTESSLLAQVAGNLAYADKTLENLSHDVDPMIRAAVAGNIHTPADTLSELSGDCHPLIRCALALNSATPDELVEPLLNDQDPDVVRAAIKHFEMREMLTKEVAKPKTKTKARSKTGKSKKRKGTKRALRIAI